MSVYIYIYPQPNPPRHTQPNEISEPSCKMKTKIQNIHTQNEKSARHAQLEHPDVDKHGHEMQAPGCELTLELATIRAPQVVSPANTPTPTPTPTPTLPLFKMFARGFVVATLMCITCIWIASTAGGLTTPKSLASGAGGGEGGACPPCPPCLLGDKYNAATFFQPRL